MEVSKCLGTSLIVLSEAAKAGCLCEGSLNDPSSDQKNEAALGLRQLDDLERDPVLGGCGSGLLTGVA